MTAKQKIIYILSVFSFMSIGCGQDCDENMYWSDCGLPFYCNSTCLNPDPLPECDDYCEIGCFCNEGYIFNNDSFNECILIENCSEQSLCDEDYVELWGECYNIEETISLNLSNSGLTGEISPEIGNLINLTYLNLYSNQLTGEIPHEIGNLINLTYLDLEINQLTGQIPAEISNLINLIFLHLNENNLTGEIPGNICDLTIDWSGIWSPEYYQIPYFNIDDNNLCPPYPECLTEEDIGEQDTSNCSLPGNNCILDNGGIGFYDCDLCCWSNDLLSWLGDGYCDMWGGCAWEGPQFDCYELGFDCGDCIDDWNEEFELNNYCEEQCQLSGDVNNDNIINIFDVIFAVECILNGNCNVCIDVDQNNAINVLDVIVIINIILDVE